MPQDSTIPPLADLRILKLGHYIAAPFRGRVPADLGAGVIEVEPPGFGDPVRGRGQSKDGRDERSVTLNPKHPKARRAVLDLVADRAGDPQYLAPGVIPAVEDPAFGSVLYSGVMPVLEGLDLRAQIRWPGPNAGARNAEIFGDPLGWSIDEIEQKRADGLS